MSAKTVTIEWCVTHDQEHSLCWLEFEYGNLDTSSCEMVDALAIVPVFESAEVES